MDFGRGVLNTPATTIKRAYSIRPYMMNLRKRGADGGFLGKFPNNHRLSLFSSQQLRASRIILWLRLHSIIEVQYFTGFKYLSSLESYRMADVEGLRGAIEDGFPI